MTLEMLGKEIKNARLKKDLSQRDLAEQTGISFSYISGLERGKYLPGKDKINALAASLNLDVDKLYLMAGYAPTKLNELSKEEDPLVMIPVLGTIKAGYDLLASQQVIGYELVPRELTKDGEYFFLKVTGESMIEDGIKEGYRVLVRRQDFVENGKIAVVLVNGDEGTLKRVFYQDGMVILQASNKNIPPRIVRVEDVRIQGQVMKVEFDV